MDLGHGKTCCRTDEDVAIVATGAFKIGPFSCGLMKWCDLLITNDSGPMHVAISQGVPIVAPYGPL